MIKLEGSKFEPSIFHLLESEELIFLIKNKIHEKNSLLVPQGWLYIQTIFIPYLQPDLRDQKLKNCVIFQQKKMDGSKAEPSISYLLELSFFHFFCRFSLFPNNFASSRARLAVYITIFIPYIQPGLLDQKMKICVIFQQKKMDGSKAEPSISYLLELSNCNFHGRFSLFPNIFASSLARLTV